MKHLPAGQGDNPGDNNGGGSNSNETTTYKVKVKAVEKSDTTQSINSVPFSIGSLTSTTGPQGGFSDELDVPAGECTLTVTNFTGYKDYSETITLSANKTDWVIQLERSG